MNAEKLKRRLRQRMNDTPLDAEIGQERTWRKHDRRLRQWLAPPLAYGAPRHFSREERQEIGEAAYDEQLPRNLSSDLLTELIDEARDGYERQGQRVTGIQSRAAVYQGGASVSGGLVLTGAGLAARTDQAPEAVMRWVVLPSLIIVALLLLLSGWRAHQASVYTFSWVRPNVRRRILRRAASLDASQARRSLLVALLLAQDRGQGIAEWKLARLKKATTYFALAVCWSVTTSSAYVVSLILTA